MSTKGRPKRVGELIRHEIAGLIAKGLKDPRIGFVSVMSVRMSPDLNYANVYVSLYGGEAERKSSLIGLRHSAGWIRREVGKCLHTRVTPEIRFFPDDTLDQVYHLQEVFEEIHREQETSPMIRISLGELLDELRKHDSFLLTTHVHPDGDAVGSLLGLACLLRDLGKTSISCLMHDPVPERYADLPGAGKVVVRPKKGPDCDVAIIIDVSGRDRIGDIDQFIRPGQRLMVIDHHLGEGPGGAIGFIDPSYAASGEIVADLFELAGLDIPPAAAHCLYVAQTTDTGGYRFSNTNARSHRIAAKLLEAGVDVPGISQRVFDAMARPKFELLRRVLDRIEIAANGRFAHTYVTAQDLDELGATKEHLDNLVNYARNIEGVQVAALFFGASPDTTKVSLRSDAGFNAASFLEIYGGGGHAAAAGATIAGAMDSLQEEIVSRIVKMLTDGPEGIQA